MRSRYDEDIPNSYKRRTSRDFVVERRHSRDYAFGAVCSENLTHVSKSWNVKMKDMEWIALRVANVKRPTIELIYVYQ